MKKLPLVLLMSYLALTLGGCGLFQKSEEPSEEPPVAESPDDGSKKAGKTPEKTDETAVTPPAPPTNNLIPSTDPSTRRNEIKKPQNKNNPFAFLPLAPVVKGKTDTSGVTNTKPGSSGGGATNAAAGSSRGGVTNAVAVESRCQASSSVVSSVPPSIPEPSLPIPNEARGVFVSGVVKFNGKSVAIVKVPNENVARQVTEGAALSNGQVRVKSINGNSLQPYIVLEQYGLNVSRAVGEPAEEPVQPPTPKAPPIAPPEPSGYGTVNNIVLQEVEIKDENSANPLVNGTLCNSGEKTLQVSTLTLQISEKGTKKIISSMRVELAATYTIEPGIQAEFDGRIGSNDNSQKSETGLRGRQKGDVTITLTDWS
ncbi:hypothetical protein VB715_18115 [Crocosphaera sp. UHCC 0190]|uniref:hypothetical protein n=1 Tax=Crocosphaera sp. UHCC 0190 TaxID=3110246 RepID=UPI002B1F60FC|nr:hypothetical protein [Crocosphaera sp. UHCC 0190]MEA5511693.1 hypothetical protein [Crocosphaera sp. UHCC 0190]